MFCALLAFAFFGVRNASILQIFRSDGNEKRLSDESDPTADVNLYRWVKKEGDLSPLTKTVKIDTHGTLDGYRGSESEMLWLTKKRKGEICATSNMNEVALGSRLALEYSKRVFYPAGKPPLAPSA